MLMRNSKLTTYSHRTAAIIGLAGLLNMAQAAVINLSDYSLSPTGDAAVRESANDVNTPNGGNNVLPGGASNSPDDVFFVTTFNFGAGSDVHLAAHFIASLMFEQDRLGIRVQDDGLVEVYGGGPLQANSTFDLAQDMAGQSVTVLVKLNYDIDRSTTNDDDTLLEAWINPTGSSSEGAPDISHVWNSRNFEGFLFRNENQNTPISAGDSSITGTRIYTDSDATFSNALAYAIPEPSVALLGGLGTLLLLRRRR